MSRINDKRSGAIFVVHQRLHQEDLTGMLIEMGWDGLALPAIAPKDITIKIGNWSRFWKNGEPLQRDRESLKELEEQKAKADVFAAQYMQDPVPESGNMLKIEWLRYYDVAPNRQSGDQLIFSIDTAHKAKSTSDYSVVLILLVRKPNEIYLLDVWRKKVEYPELYAAVFELVKKHGPNAILIEDKVLGSPLISQLKSAGIAGVIPINPKTDKITRMAGETAKLQAGCLIIPRNSPFNEDFKLEWKAFPNGKYDDQMDPLSQLLNWLTTAPLPSQFTVDWGNGDDGAGGSGEQLGAPSPEEILSRRRRN